MPDSNTANSASSPASATANRFVSSSYAAILVKTCQYWQVTPAQVLANTGISEQQLADGSQFIDQQAYRQLVNNALTCTGEPSLGLHYGQRLNITTHGLLGYAIMASEDFQSAAELGIKYIKIRNPLISIDFRVDNDLAEICFDVLTEDPRLYRFEIEASLSSVFTIWRFMAGEDAGIQHISIRYPAPDDQTDYATLFDCPYSFGQARNSLVFSVEQFHAPGRTADPAVARIAVEQCEQLLSSIDQDDDLVSQVRKLLLKSADGFNSQDAVARELNMTRRTLSRHLKKHDTSFQQIVDEVRNELALQYLRNTDWTIERITYALGYSDPSNFGRAFRRWHQMSPQQYCDQQQWRQSNPA